MDRSEKLSRVRAFCARAPHSVLFDETGETLFDVRAVKTLALHADDLRSVEELRDRQTQAPYLQLGYEDGHALALTAAGIAFAPEFANTGPLDELPPALCFADLGTMMQRARHALFDHPEAKPGAEVVRLVQCSIALVDGARAVGFDVSREERELEAILSQLERQVRG